jgi:hypothetical protein
MDDWDLQLDAVLFGIRTKMHVSTGFSPFRLLYHREARLPSQMDDAMNEVSYLSFKSRGKLVLHNEESPKFLFYLETFVGCPLPHGRGGGVYPRSGGAIGCGCCPAGT